MKLSTLFIFLFITFAKAQQPCDFIKYVSADSTTTYQTSADIMLYEKNFGRSSDYIIASLVVSESSAPMLSLQFIEKSGSFKAAKCLDKNSKVFLQLDNGKIVTLLHIAKEDCGSRVASVQNTESRIITGYFLFVKDVFEELKRSKISLMRVRFMTETVDYIIKNELTSELDGKTYHPASYFLDFFHCLTEAY